ncbi:hypothetical protein Mal48_31330 [Thalassoglobus polymorphus]|uniref:Uncharacterized protein n=1 Tax=Thalassoglobus polymorphus TaxID=2527994 RepID=A0A517QQH4_9PLAN|nr:hypothetical protein Mal48_31330 [Thalassoglobus polymorphus]
MNPGFALSIAEKSNQSTIGLYVLHRGTAGIEIAGIENALM